MQSTADTIIAFNRCAIFITNGTTKQKEGDRFPLLVDIVLFQEKSVTEVTELSLILVPR